MTAPADNPQPMPSAAACAEAAAWIARLHGAERTAKVETGFKRWLAASPEHRVAFDMANEIWVSTEHLPKPRTPAFVRWPRAALVITLPRALVSAALVILAGIGLVLSMHDSGLSTRVGEQRNFSLPDGTRVSLNTASRIQVRYDHHLRRVELDHGEAYFEVAKHPDWPFIVVAGREEVLAHGTAFLVRRDQERLAVTLMEGKVTVSPTDELEHAVPTAGSPASLDAPASRSALPASHPTTASFTLKPGDRVTFAEHEPPKVDHPSLDRETAWQHGQVILDHTPLAQAVAEMNRYSALELKIEDPVAARTEVTGIFRVGDSASFAQAVAETYHLQVSEHGAQIVLAGEPRASGVM